MPQITIPKLGDVILLEQDWTFRLYDESRNKPLQDAAWLHPPFRCREGMSRSWRNLSLAERAAEIDKTDWVYTRPEGMSITSDGNYWTGDWDHEFTFRAGTELKFDRYYIRQGSPTFDSVTFRTNCWVSQLGDPLFSASRKLKNLRFWAKLDDVNRIEGRFVTRM